MDIIFCLSYLSLNQTIFLIEKKEAKNTIVITSNKSIEKFLSSIYNEDIVYFVNSSSLLLPNNLKRLIVFPLRILDAIIKKYIVWSYFKRIKNSKVYFFFNSAAFFHAWLIYKLSRNNEIFYKEDLNLDSFNEVNTRVTYLNKKFINFFYKEEVIPLDQKTGTTYKISNHFLKKCKTKRIQVNFTDDETIKIISSKIDFPNGNILYLPPLLGESKINEVLYIDVIDKIITFCEKRNINIHLKRHPRSGMRYSLENKIFEVPIYYPASCLANYQITIGYATATLFERANQGGFTISLIRMLNQNDKKMVNFTMNYLNSNLDEGQKIIFPENLEELISVILDIIETG